jgi:hypothetical protein
VNTLSSLSVLPLLKSYLVVEKMQRMVQGKSSSNNKKPAKILDRMILGFILVRNIALHCLSEFGHPTSGFCAESIQKNHHVQNTCRTGSNSNLLFHKLMFVLLYGLLSFDVCLRGFT